MAAFSIPSADAVAMGSFRYFARRHARESAVPQSGAGTEPEIPATPSSSPLFDAPAGPDESEEGVAPPAPAAGLGEVGRLIRSALEQGNVTVVANGEALDLREAGLQGNVFDPVHLPEIDADDPSAPS